ncbi:MAG TPA: NAD(P)-binding protein, partial [Phycisphaerales bacterium]|nr:NAD(P)-binding protein [Phycisphaerales bacterium]
SLERIEAFLRRRPRVWRLLNARADRRAADINARAQPLVTAETRPIAVIVGYGPVGRLVDALLRDAGVQTVIVDMNIDTVRALTRSGRLAIYGDATRREVLEHAGIRRAVHLVVTLPSATGRGALVLTARELSPEVEIIVRARHLAERESLLQAGAGRIIFEEGEAGIALARHVMERRGLDRQTIDGLLGAVRKVWRMEE